MNGTFFSSQFINPRMKLMAPRSLIQIPIRRMRSPWQLQRSRGKHAHQPIAAKRFLLIFIRISAYTDTCDQFDEGVLTLDKLTLQDRKKREKDNKSSARSRHRGDRKNVPLPRPGINKLKIPREAICPAWLAANKEENDTPTRIQAA